MFPFQSMMSTNGTDKARTKYTFEGTYRISDAHFHGFSCLYFIELFSVTHSSTLQAFGQGNQDHISPGCKEESSSTK